MPHKGFAIFGLYLDFKGLRGCIDCLKAIGIKSNDVSVLLPDGSVLSTLFLSIDPRTIVASKHENKASHENGQHEWNAISGMGALSQSLSFLGIPIYAQERYEARVRSGAILIAVRCESPFGPEDIFEIFNQTGAVSLSSSLGEKAARSLERSITTSHLHTQDNVTRQPSDQNSPAALV